MLRSRCCSSPRLQFKTLSETCHSVKFQNHSNTSDPSIRQPFQMESKCALKPLQEPHHILVSTSALAQETSLCRVPEYHTFFKRWLKREPTRCLRPISQLRSRIWEVSGTVTLIESTLATECKLTKVILPRLSKCLEMLSATFN